MRKNLESMGGIDISYPSSSIALFASIEADLQDINTQKQGCTRYYEREAIKCFKCWRKNAGWLADIPIYAICPTQNTISQETKNKFRELNITYIEEYFPETEEYLNGYWNIPLVGRWAEENLQERVLIKIDLDMYIIRELPGELFEDSILPLVGQYDEMSAKNDLNNLNFPLEYGPPFDTGLIVTARERGFYRKFFKTLKRITEEFDGDPSCGESKYGIKIGEGDLNYGALEEFSLSVLNREEPGLLNVITKYNIGEYYRDIDYYEDSELRGIYFIHEHLPVDNLKYNGSLLRLKYKKRMLKMGVPNNEILLDNCD